MNEFGGNWTKEKIELFMKYVPAYLKIMKSTIEKNGYAKDWKLMFFDGFAGSGEIILDTDEEIIESVATQVLSITEPRSFDFYRFVELRKKNAQQLQTMIDDKFPNKSNQIKIYQEDFNEVVKKMAGFLNDSKYKKKIKTLMFIDPFGMQVNWESIEMLKDLSIDMWILVPTGIGINRMLKNDGNINEKWLEKLQKFLNLSEQEIKDNFYKTETITNLFGEETTIKKENNAVEIAHNLYKEKLETIFKYISESYVMKNQNNSLLYHFLLASNNENAVKIANSIIGKGISKLNEK